MARRSSFWRAAIAGVLLVAPPMVPGAAVAAGRGGVVTWGFNSGGQLGANSANWIEPEPVPVTGLGAGSPVVEVAAGTNHNVAVRSDGTVVAWGSDCCGQLGDGADNVDQAVPVPVSGLGTGSRVVAVAAGFAHSLALRSDGSVLAWGRDEVGTLGDGGANLDQTVPVAVSGLGPGSGVVAVAAGFYHSLALRSDGSVLAWGLNAHGQLGDGSGVDRSTPVAVSGLGPGSGVVAVAAGDVHSLALRADGRVLAWGGDDSGELGDGGANVEQHVPVPVAGLGTGSGVVAVDGGGSHSVALRSDGLVVTWGSDAFGQLGDDGEYANRSVPVPVSGLVWGSGVVAVAAGYGHNLALRADGSVMAWGFNSTGQLGVGGAGVDQPTPLAVNGLTAGSGVAAVAAGYGHSVALKRAKGAAVDFDGNRTTDVAVYRPSTGVWWVRTPFGAVHWGDRNDIPVAGDYDGNGSTEHAVYRPSTGIWYLYGPPFKATLWGEPGDVPVPADYDGNGTTDVAVYRPSTGVWYVQTPFAAVTWGEAGDIPIPGDYDGDGRADRAVYRPSTGVWFLLGSYPRAFAWGEPGDIPIPGDYDADGTTDVAVYRPSTGVWWVRSPFWAAAWGEPGDVPVPGDYDGNGTTDVAVYRPSTGVWWVRSPFWAAAWGEPGDLPLTLPQTIYRRFF